MQHTLRTATKSEFAKAIFHASHDQIEIRHTDSKIHGPEGREILRSVPTTFVTVLGAAGQIVARATYIRGYAPDYAVEETAPRPDFVIEALTGRLR